MSDGAVYYRFRDCQVSVSDAFGESFSTRLDVYREEFRVIKETPKGVWIEMDFAGGKRFVRHDALKKFAHPTTEAARESFRARKRRQIKILTKQLENAQRALSEIDEWRAAVEGQPQLETQDHSAGARGGRDRERDSNS